MMVNLPSDQARDLARNALLASGACKEVADVVSLHAVDSELAGHPSHGLRLIPIYCASSGSPGTDLAAMPRILSRSGAVTTIDACRGLGHLAMALGVDCAASAAHELGAGVSAVVQCGHAGRAGAWVERGVERGCATSVMLGGSAPPFVMAAGPGARPALHTNPVAFGLPASGHPLLLDMATSLVAEGKVHVAMATNSPLPTGAILAADGTVSDDPAAFLGGGCLLPAAGHKGFGLSAIVEAMSVLMTGADAPGRLPLEGGLVLCIKADAFRPLSEVTTSVDAMRSRLRRSGAVQAPGDPEAERRRAAAGQVRIEEALAEELRAIGGTP